MLGAVFDAKELAVVADQLINRNRRQGGWLAPPSTALTHVGRLIDADWLATQTCRTTSQIFTTQITTS